MSFPLFSQHMRGTNDPPQGVLGGWFLGQVVPRPLVSRGKSLPDPQASSSLRECSLGPVPEMGGGHVSRSGG